MAPTAEHGFLAETTTGSAMAVPDGRRELANLVVIEVGAAGHTLLAEPMA